jgi:predicted metalloprotease with PDZ domain
MIAGKVGTRRANISKTSIAVSAPKGENFKRMDALTFFNFVWPELHKAFKKTPEKLLVVGAGDPMWRGGLSASNSLFLHADRPLVSENGTSPLLHELTHMVTRISGVTTSKTNDDWIAEGLAEFYSFELLYRANGMTKSRRNKIIKNLAKWGADVKHLRQSKSTGPVTARAVVLLDTLDKEIRKRSGNKHNIDDVTQDLMGVRKVSLADLQKSVERLIGPKIDTLDSALLK